MSILPKKNPAPRGSTTPAKWTRGNKEAVGTSMGSSPIWFTLGAGVISEVYYPTVDTPQIRDLQFLVTDGRTFFHDGRRDFTATYTCLADGVPGHRMVCTANGQPYRIVQEILTSPRYPCLLVRLQLESVNAPAGFLDQLHMYLLVAPHVDGKGEHNNAYVGQTRAGAVLLAQRGSSWLAVGANSPFRKCSVGYVGSNDGWQDIVGQKRLMSYAYDSAEDGNVALTAELTLANDYSALVGLSFGQDALDLPDLDQSMIQFRSEAPAARVALAEALGEPFAATQAEFIAGWNQAIAAMPNPDPKAIGHQARLYQASRTVLMCHQDKIYDGAFVASLSIPWGEDTGDQDAGYHLVWPRDMSQTASALLAAGDGESALRGLMFLASSQQNDGSFRQNFMVDGFPNGKSLQLDELSFPVLLGYRLRKNNQFHPLPLVIGAANALILLGPQTPEERWEEQAGFSPSTLASNIAALICAATMVRPQNAALADFYEDYADFLERHIEDWTVTKRGGLLPGVTRHYIRISNREDPDQASVPGSNGQPGVAANQMVDAGFLELVRYGVRAATDPLIADSVRVVDHVLAQDLSADGQPPRICFFRYNHDGYGQKADGRGWKADPNGVGVGGPWPLLAGERAHYELARKNLPDVMKYLKSFESFATESGLFPEQVWHFLDNSAMHLVRGGPTGAAVPLAWAHAEYIKLVLSIGAGRVLDIIPEVEGRYITRNQGPSRKVEIWNFQRKNEALDFQRRAAIVRFPIDRPFVLRWSNNTWQTFTDSHSTEFQQSGIHVVDLPTAGLAGPTFVFTFFWPTDNRWEGSNFTITL
jgi:glucoamylase